MLRSLRIIIAQMNRHWIIFNFIPPNIPPFPFVVQCVRARARVCDNGKKNTRTGGGGNSPVHSDHFWNHYRFRKLDAWLLFRCFPLFARRTAAVVDFLAVHLWSFNFWKPPLPCIYACCHLLAVLLYCYPGRNSWSPPSPYRTWVVLSLSLAVRRNAAC